MYLRPDWFVAGFRLHSLFVYPFRNLNLACLSVVTKYRRYSCTRHERTAAAAATVGLSWKVKLMIKKKGGYGRWRWGTYILQLQLYIYLVYLFLPVFIFLITAA